MRGVESGTGPVHGFILVGFWCMLEETRGIEGHEAGCATGPTGCAILRLFAAQGVVMHLGSPAPPAAGGAHALHLAHRAAASALLELAAGRIRLPVMRTGGGHTLLPRGSTSGM